MFLSQCLSRVLLSLFLAIAGSSAAMAQNPSMDHSDMNHSTTGSESEGVTPNSAPPMDNMSDHGGTAHGDHNPKFGGLVLMYGLLHFELVGKPEGGVLLYLSDAMRAPMPAASVSDVTVEIERLGGEYEVVMMAVSEAGDFWSGSSAPLVDQENTMLHLAFVAFGAPYVYAVPLSALRSEEPSSDKPSETAMIKPGSGFPYAR